jgi:hypothetical protein
MKKPGPARAFLESGFLRLWTCGAETSTAQVKEVFCFFFQKRSLVLF